MNKRDRLIDSAALLFHHKGLTATSLADIAKHAEIPIGNVYYYFKTKEELAVAAIARRREQLHAIYALLDEQNADPRRRLIESVQYFEKAREEFTRYGCPIGKIIADTGGDKDPVAQAAAQTFADFVGWAERQFQQLGHHDDAHKYGISLMAGLQGAVVMAKAAQNAQIITDEIARLTAWIEQLPNRRIQLGKVAARSVDAA